MAELMSGMTDQDKLRHGQSFDQAVAAYERARPGYPEEAVRWMVPAGADGVLDLAAGTGKLTRVIAAAGFSVTAVEPLDGMRAELARQLPGVRALAGAAEGIPLPDRCVDAVLVGQAWHWFEESRAVPEISRVLRPGGALGLVWNDWDDARPWVRRVRELTNEAKAATKYGIRVGSDERAEWQPALGSDFGTPRWKLFRFTQLQDPATVLENVASRSYVITLPDAERAAVLAEVAELLRTDPDTAGRELIELPYRTRAMRADKHPE